MRRFYPALLILPTLLFSQEIRIRKDVNTINAFCLRAEVSLNGLWDFYPVLDEKRLGWHRPTALPQDGWLEEAILVPGSWTRGYKNPGDDNPAQCFWAEWRLFDSYGYPEEWNRTQNAWYRRTFFLNDVRRDSRYFLRFGGVLRESWVFVNGMTAGISLNGILPKEYDVTELLQTGENVLHVYCTDYRRDENERTFTPTGADQMEHQAGIWQDVILLRRPDCYIDDVTIRTSVRRNELTVLLTVVNASKRPRTVTPAFIVREKDRDCLGFGAEPLKLEPGERRQIVVVQSWSSYRPWSPQSPYLYHLVSRLQERDQPLDERIDRFGFREVWIEGRHIMLNGSPIHLFGEWGHKSSFDSFRPEYVRQWFRMLKACNMNYIRTHTFPHPSLWLDLADEMGILVCVESAWFFTHTQALDKEELWKNAEQHVREIIARDKNHPSVILWSVGNEVRWSWNRTLVIQNMPRLRRLYHELDPTRIAYHDGDSSLWDESEQLLISRHYGVECTGEDWWDRSKPLHVGEVGKWHYGQPIDNLIWGDDTVFSSFEECHKAVALECADLAEQARANEVACFFPWNLSGLDNWRPWEKERRFYWPDLTAPGLKPLRSAPYGSEFAWWNADALGYEPGPSFEIMRHAFRPFALVVREKRTQVYSDQMIRHTVTLINDTGGPVTGTFEVTASLRGKSYWKRSWPLTLDNGYTKKFELEIPPPAVISLQTITIDSRFYNKARVFDSCQRKISVMPQSSKTAEIDLPMIAVYGDGSMNGFIRRHQLAAVRLKSLAEADPKLTRILLIEKDAVRPNSTDHLDVAAFLQRGGRVILLEQSHSLFPQVPLENRPTERAHMRGGWSNLLAEMEADDFAYWGDDPYGKRDSDSWVVVKPYRKPEIGEVTVFLHSAYGDFGGGGLFWTPLFETRLGNGVLLACQLRVTDKLDEHPAALKLLYAMLRYLADYSPREEHRCTVVGELPLAEKLGVITADTLSADIFLLSGKTAADSQICRQLKKAALKGATVLVSDVDPACAATLRKVLDIDLQLVEIDTVYNLVRWGDDMLLEGISHQETYWLDRGQYSSSTLRNMPMTNRLLRCTGADELLVNEYASAWREFFTLGANHEQSRMPVMTHLLWNGPRKHAAGLMRINVGKGEFLLCQVPFIVGYHHSHRFWTYLLSNLGVRFNKSIFEGEMTLIGAKMSEGRPQRLHCLFNPDSSLLKNVFKYRWPAEYRLPNDGLSSAFIWAEVPVEKGRLKLDDAYRDVLIYFQIDPGRPRVRKEDADAKDSALQPTFLSLRGGGRILVYVNGRKHDDINLGEGGFAVTSPIDLHRFWNSIILHWMPKGNSLELGWRNAFGRPEFEFDFQ
ncbi:MAG: hypothetical protein ONB24_09515 [candidate division KSB1 bacterium]|nr:hypothetical protein [candidate division KSB1 bacterium]